MKGSKRFLWDDKCQQAFKALKEYLGKLPLLSKHVDGEPLFLYLVVSEYAVSWALIDAETRYPDIEKLALALLIASRKLRQYFHSYTICVLTNYPLRQVIQKPDALGRLLKWAIKLS